MTKINKNTLRIAAAVLCIALIVLGGLIGRTRAALLEGNGAQVELGMETLAVQLTENGVNNNGASEEYVRVIVTKYWTDDGGKVTTVSPDDIELVLGNGWAANKKESTAEQTVYYCNKSLAPGGSSTLFTGIKLDADIAGAYTIKEKSEDDKTTLIAEFKYDGLTFNVEAEAQAVQYEHGQEAAGSAWGVTNVTFNNGSVTVQD